MTEVRSLLIRLIFLSGHDSRQSLVEHGLLSVLIAVAVAVAIPLVGGAARN